ncbi:DTX45, partial [Symbiodinium pilosum]
VTNRNRHVYALHREAQWSLQRLHNPKDKRYKAEGAGLFVRYFEDHTGTLAIEAQNARLISALLRMIVMTSMPPCKGAEKGRKFEHPGFEQVVMEYLDHNEAKLLQNLFDINPPMDWREKRAITKYCVESLVYLSKFNALHRDFRGCNIFLVGRGKGCKIKVIDLGFMICADDWQAKNPNVAVRCAWQGITKDQRIRFDWAPPEVRTKELRNFGLPASSFDVFSLGILLMKVMRGRRWTQDAHVHMMQ